MYAGKFRKKENYGKNLGQLSLDETYAALLKLVQEKAGQKEIHGKKKLYYISAEFLIGKLFEQQSDQSGDLRPD